MKHTVQLSILFLFLHGYFSLQSMVQPNSDNIFEAIENGNLEMVKDFIAKNNFSTNTSTKHWENVFLSHATAHNQIDIVAYLLQQKADVNHKNYYGNTALHKVKSPIICQLLIEKGANVDAENNIGYSPLDFSTVSNLSEISQLLISHGANCKLDRDKCRR